MKKDCYEPGDVLCDMHYGFRYLPDNLHVKAHIRAKPHSEETCENIATKMVRAANHGKCPDNKFLVVIGSNASYDGIVACYSYDGSLFGMVELEYIDVAEEIDPEHP